MGGLRVRTRVSRRESASVALLYGELCLSANELREGRGGELGATLQQHVSGVRVQAMDAPLHARAEEGSTHIVRQELGMEAPDLECNPCNHWGGHRGA